MRIICPKCNTYAQLTDDFTYVNCTQCGLDIKYGEYIKLIAYNDLRYTDILNDYKNTNTETLDDWE